MSTICSIETTTLAAKLPHHLKNGKAFYTAPLRQTILVYDTKYSIYFDPCSEMLHPEMLSIRFRAVGRPIQAIALHKGRILCALIKGGTEVMIKDIRGGVNPFAAVHLKIYRKDGATMIDTPNGVFICGGIDKKGHYMGNGSMLTIPNDFGHESFPSATRPRAYAAAVYIHGELYVIGGDSANGRRCGWTDIFNTQTLQGRRGPDLNFFRSNCCAIVLHNRWIVVMGGGVGDAASPTRSIEILDTNDTSAGWVVGGMMERPRKKFSVIPIEDKVYIFGGGVEEIERMRISFVEPSAPSAIPPLIAEQIPAFGPNGDEKPAAIVKKKSDATVSQTESPAAARWSSIEINVDLFPEPPTLPVVRPCFTVANRTNALEEWTQEAEALQAEFITRMSNSVEQLNEVFDTARDLKIKQMEQRSSEWLDDTQRQIQKAHEEVAQNNRLLKETSAASSSLLVGKDLDDFADDVPSQLRCPITLSLMMDPVVASDGITYERDALEAWMKKEQTSPLTGAPLASSAMFPNRMAKSLCDDFVNDRKNAPNGE